MYPNSNYVSAREISLTKPTILFLDHGILSLSLCRTQRQSLLAHVIQERNHLVHLGGSPVQLQLQQELGVHVELNEPHSSVVEPPGPVAAGAQAYSPGYC